MTAGQLRALGAGVFATLAGHAAALSTVAAMHGSGGTFLLLVASLVWGAMAGLFTWSAMKE